MNDLESLAATLAADPDYRVLRRLDSAYGGGPTILTGGIRRAAIVDVETTGMDLNSTRSSKSASSCSSMEPSRARSVPSWRGTEVSRIRTTDPPESTKIHGITDEMVRGKRLDESAIETVVSDVGVVIAHNAGFDRPFLEARLPMFAGLHWACSINDVRWKAHGYGSSALEFLAYRSGLFL